MNEFQPQNEYGVSFGVDADPLALALYALPLVLVVAVFVVRRRRAGLPLEGRTAVVGVALALTAVLLVDAAWMAIASAFDANGAGPWSAAAAVVAALALAATAALVRRSRERLAYALAIVLAGVAGGLIAG